jgi:DNA-binding HxlR family transcriptional regulator
MNAKSAVFAVVAIKPHAISELINKLPYSRRTVYKALADLERDGLIKKNREGTDVVVEVSDGYKPQKLRDIYIKSLSFGIDPEMLLRDSTLVVWKSIDQPRTLREIQKDTNLSDKWVRKVLNFLADSNLVIYKKRKPVVAALNEEHELSRLLKIFIDEERKVERVYYKGTIPFERLIKTPDEIEKILYKKIDSSLAVKDTGFIIRGEDKLSVLESVEKELTREEQFLREIKTPEGVEDFCIRLIASGKLDYEKLLELGKELNIVNVVGCYLEILNDIKKIVGSEVIMKFQQNVSKRKVVFLKGEKRYGKGGWEGKYEKKWNVDLYIDIGAIKHGLRSV